MAGEEWYPKMSFGEQVQMLVHTHFEPQRITAAKVKVEARIASKAKPDRKADYEARLAEYDARLAEINTIWTTAPDDVRAAAHDRIALHDASGLLRGGV